jgi:hypothetical protein
LLIVRGGNGAFYGTSDRGVNLCAGCHRSEAAGLSPAQDSAQDTSLDRLREQVGLVSEQQCQELALSFEPSILGRTARRVAKAGRSF